MLLDQLVAEPEFSERHERLIAAPPAAVDAAVIALTPSEARLLGPAAALRALPTVVRHPRRLLGELSAAIGGVGSRPVLELMLDSGFIELGRAEGREIVLGVVGKLWTLTDTAPVRLAGAAEFGAFAQPAYAKAALGFACASAPGGATDLVTETRVVTTSEDAHRSFERYWGATVAAGGVIRRSWLAAIERRALAG